MNFQKLEQVFTDYVNSFDRTNKKINIKYEHTLRVSKISEVIASKLQLSEYDVYLAKIIGLLHDISRFYEETVFKTFRGNNFDHASYGVKLLFEDMMIKDYIKDEKDYEVIKKAIFYHNKYALPIDLNERETLFCKIIRDADKIDLYYVYYQNFANLFEEKPSAIALSFINNHKCLSKKEVSGDNKSDVTLEVIAMMYDINFKISFDYLEESKNFEHYLGSIVVSEENKETFRKIIEDVNEYVRKKI